MARTRKRVLASMGALAVTLGGASFAWACSGQALVVFGGASSSASGPAGTSIVVNGSRWEDKKPVQVRWNSATGQELKTTPSPVEGPSFSVMVEIPGGAPTGVHTVYFIQYERDLETTQPGGSTSITGTARLPFEVTPAGSDVRYSDEKDDVENRTSAGTSGGESSSRRQATTGASGGEGQFSTGSGQRTGSASGGDAVGASSGPQSQSFGNLAPSGSSSPGTGQNDVATAQPGTSSNPSGSVERRTAAATTSGQPVFGGSVASTGPSSTPTALAAPGEESNVSSRSASGDVWAGFEPGNASLVPSLSDTAGDSSTSGSSLAIGMGFLGGGLGMLFAGFGIAEVRRQRALARQG